MTDTGLIVGLGEQLYSVVRPWGHVPSGLDLAYVSDVAVDSKGYVYLGQRATPPVVVFDPDGQYVRSWGADTIADVHGIYITPEDLVLIVDRDVHQVLAFDLEGHLLFGLGERNKPRFQAPFNHPTDVAVSEVGDIYVTDGYGNSMVHWFSPEGELRGSWGQPGTGPGEFTTPHGIWVDKTGHVLVGDRENNRLQVFTSEGDYVDAWPDFFHPMDIYGDAQGRIYVTDQIPRLSMLTSSGTLIGRCRPVLYTPHGIWGDSAGNIYLAESSPMDRLTKLVPLS
jgi:peptidylglycine monooxygenase